MSETVQSISPEAALLAKLRDPVNHKQGVASMPMLEAAQWLEGHGTEEDKRLIAQLRDPQNHLQQSLTMPMLSVAQRIGSLIEERGIASPTQLSPS